MDITLALALAIVWGLLAFLAWDVMAPLWKRDLGTRKASQILEYRRSRMQ